MAEDAGATLVDPVRVVPGPIFTEALEPVWTAEPAAGMMKRTARFE